MLLPVTCRFFHHVTVTRATTAALSAGTTGLRIMAESDVSRREIVTGDVEKSSSTLWSMCSVPLFES